MASRQNFKIEILVEKANTKRNSSEGSATHAVFRKKAQSYKDWAYQFVMPETGSSNFVFWDCLKGTDNVDKNKRVSMKIKVMGDIAVLILNTLMRPEFICSTTSLQLTRHTYLAKWTQEGKKGLYSFMKLKNG